MNNKGVTLMELMVAIFLMSISLAPTVMMYNSSLRINKEADNITKAILAGKTVMARLLLPKTNDSFSSSYDTDFNALANIGSSTSLQPSDYKGIKWYAVVETVSGISNLKKIKVVVKYPKGQDPTGGEVVYITYRYNLD
ncbi:MAG TPA: prepilin-type N-terminal cleavage/methylation domain-containing protein [bacterium]|nr:prepilin-type N-terminal cleavage/methylation domain-containing protein [bacterium]HOL48885.1 prepilin-type N-terminal cleavage/methylation domain-containing protein [bacterium]HPQ19059.1 prepilin-type N-terminal cleavage/methylation domain-containing protein [bacterium]